MPRRRSPVKPTAFAIFSKAEIARLRTLVTAVVHRDPKLRHLPERTRNTLIDSFVNAIGYAQAGLRDVVSGKRAKPNAWAADILVKDVCDALRAVGARPVMRSQQIHSVAQGVAHDLGIIAGLPMSGELFHQMRRARRIESGWYRPMPVRWMLHES